jgi:hypothetical protein
MIEVIVIHAILWFALPGGLAYLLYSERSASARSESRRTGRAQRWLALIIGLVWMSPFYPMDSHSNLTRVPLPEWVEAALYVASLAVVFALLSRRIFSGRIAMVFLFMSGCAIAIFAAAIIDSEFFGYRPESISIRAWLRLDHVDAIRHYRNDRRLVVS